ncbi:hypothetical protein PTKIN_Ptkin02bG0048200 [Pterospermum kingtungense]
MAELSVGTSPHWDNPDRKKLKDFKEDGAMLAVQIDSDFTNVKECKNFALCLYCLELLCTTRHKRDEHLLTLIYHDNDDTYSRCHFCDICEEERNPNIWFDYSAIGDNFVHLKCVLGRKYIVHFTGFSLNRLLAYGL